MNYFVFLIILRFFFAFSFSIINNVFRTVNFDALFRAEHDSEIDLAIASRETLL